MTRLSLLCIATAAALTLLTANGGSIAQDSNGGAFAPDFELARDAVERGEILPLAKLLPRIAKDYAGKVIEVELEISAASKVYEFEVLTDSGRLLEVDVDAASGKVLSVDEED